MNQHVRIMRADSPCARCVNCGSEQQYHGRPGRICADFKAETVQDVEPAALDPLDLIRAVTLATNEIEAIDRLADPTLADNENYTRHWVRRQACLAEIAERNRAVFGLRWDDFAAMMGDL